MSSRGGAAEIEKKGGKRAAAEDRPRRTIPASEDDEEASWDDDAAVPMDIAKGSAAIAAAAAAADDDEDDDEEYEEELEEKIPAEMRKLIKDKADGKYLLSLNELEREEELDRRFTAYRKRMELEELENMESGAKDKDSAASKKRRLSKGKDKEPAPSKRATVAKKRSKPMVEDEDEIDNEQWDEVLADSDEEEEAEEEAFVEEDEDKDEAEQESSEQEEEDEEEETTGRGRRLSTRRSTAKSRAESKLDELAAARRAARGGRKDDSSVEEGELSEAEAPRVEESVDDSPLGELKDYLILQVKRSFLEQNNHEPWFENAVIGQFVRVAIPGMTDGTQQYRMAEVIGIVPSTREYQLGPNRINKQLEVQIGKARKTFRMVFVSEHRFTPEEFEFYKTHQLDARVPMLTQKQIQARRRRFKQAVFQHTYTQEEISKMVEARDIVTVLASKDYTTIRKELEDRLEEARQVENFDVMDDLQKKLRKLDEHWSIAQLASKQQNDTLRQINERNKRRNLLADIAGRRHAGPTERAAAKEKQTDPFARRAMRPRTLWVTNKSNMSSSSQQQQQQGAEESKGNHDDHASSTPALARQVSGSSVLGDNVEVNDDGTAHLTDDVIELRYGFNPAAIPPLHSRPLGNRFSSVAKITSELPPKGSEAREALRKQLGGMSLAEYLSQTQAPIS